MQGLELEALLAEFFHVLPDGDAAHAEFLGEGGAGDHAGFGVEQGLENDGFGLGRFHASGQSRPMSTQQLWCTSAPVETKSRPRLP